MRGILVRFEMTEFLSEIRTGHSSDLDVIRISDVRNSDVLYYYCEYLKSGPIRFSDVQGFLF